MCSARLTERARSGGACPRSTASSLPGTPSGSAQAERLHALRVPLLQPPEQRRNSGEIPGTADDELGQPVALGYDVLGLGQRLTEQAAPPQGELVAGLGVGFDAGGDFAFGERRVAGVGE